MTPTPNHSIEQTIAGKPSISAHVKRWAANPTQLDTLRIGDEKDIGMKFKKASMAVYIAIVLITAAGCATTGTNGIVPIGPDMYMVGGHGKFTDFSGSAVKARFYQDASKFCSEKNRVMLPINSTAQDSAYATYASAEIQFRCVPSDDPRLPK